MADTPARADDPPEPFLTTVAPPRWFATFAMIVVASFGLLLLWIVSLNPLFGVPLNDAVALTVAGLVVLVGVGGVVYVWRQPAEAWRKVPDGPLSPEFRRLADAG